MRYQSNEKYLKSSLITKDSSQSFAAISTVLNSKAHINLRSSAVLPTLNSGSMAISRTNPINKSIDTSIKRLKESLRFNNDVHAMADDSLAL